MAVFKNPGQWPSTATIDIYIVDMTARIQVFTPDGTFLNKWQTPDHQFGKPTGLSIGNDGNVLVANTHYYEVLIYSPDGQLIKRLGGTKGEQPGRVRAGDPCRPGFAQQYLRFRIRRIRPHPKIHARGRVHPAMGRPRIRAGPVHQAAKNGRRRRRSHLGGRCLQPPHPGFRLAGKIAENLGKRRQPSPANFIIPTTCCWPRTEPSTSASSATIACSDSPATAARWAVGAAKADKKANSTIPGPWSATAKA